VREGRPAVFVGDLLHVRFYFWKGLDIFVVKEELQGIVMDVNNNSGSVRAIFSDRLIALTEDGLFGAVRFSINTQGFYAIASAVKCVNEQYAKFLVPTKSDVDDREEVGGDFSEMIFSFFFIYLFISK
jgi:hypothetical protein